MILNIFITHKGNINRCYPRISKMMSDLKSDNWIIVQGGSLKDNYDEEKKIINLSCNDSYAGLPEKVARTFHFIISDDRFKRYDMFSKLDDDMLIIDIPNNIKDDYTGYVHYTDGNRKWHMGRCGNHWDQIPYLGKFEPWCMGGFGYIVSRKALEKALPNFDYLDHIYEDVYIGILMKNIGVIPKPLNVKKYFKSPDHI